MLLVGSGDNGGDALYAGALLARRGCRVSAWLLSEKPHEGGLAALDAGRRAHDHRGAARGSQDLVVDGIVGIGGRPGLKPEAVAALEALAGRARSSPSTYRAASTSTPASSTGRRCAADVTVTFGTHKVALLADPAAAARRRGPPASTSGSTSPTRRVESLQADDVAALLPRPDEHAHKYTRGVVGVRAGSVTYPGAGVLCVAGAASGLCGMVRYVGGARDEVIAAHPDVVVANGRVQAWTVGSGGGPDVATMLAEAQARRRPARGRRRRAGPRRRPARPCPPCSRRTPASCPG